MLQALFHHAWLMVLGMEPRVSRMPGSTLSVEGHPCVPSPSLSSSSPGLTWDTDTIRALLLQGRNGRWNDRQGRGALSQRPALSAAVGKKDENQFTVAVVAHRKERMCRADVYKPARGRVLHVCAHIFVRLGKLCNFN